MRDRQHFNDLRANTIRDVIWKTWHTETPRDPSRTSCLWVGKYEVHRLTHRKKKAVPETGNRRFVVLDRGAELLGRVGMKLQSHRASFRSTAAKTSAAGTPATVPLVNAAAR
jgi:hypothetical protein